MGNFIQDTLGNICLITAAWMIASGTFRRKLFILRTVVCLCMMCVLRYVYFYILEPWIQTAISPSWLFQQLLSMLGFTLLIALTVLAVMFSFDCGFWPALFCGGTSYCVQHICQRCYRLLSRTCLAESPEYLHILVYIGMMLLCLALAHILIKKQRIDKIMVDNETQLFAVLAVIASAMMLDLLFFKAMREGGELLQLCFTIYSVLTSALLFLMQLGMVSGKKKDLELGTIKSILESEEKQYFFEKSLIDTINIKCHDLKHQIALLEREGAARTELAGELREAVNSYDSVYHTGNTALDVVLTRESFNCEGKNISLTCIADGTCLDFISEADVYSLFGNILDNAIEATEKIADEKKRVISLSVAQEGYFINIHAENYYTDKLTFTNGLPQTTKADSAYHGFGMKSIKMLVYKYGGSLKIYTKEERFVLDIMFSV